jgi:hypothetical protein
MPIQRVIHAVPIALYPATQLRFDRALLLPGVTLRCFTGPISTDIARRVEALPQKPSFIPTHIIVVNQATYLKGLDGRLKWEGLSRPVHEYEIIDIAGITRQVLVAIMLVGRLAWQVGGYHTFDFSDADFPYRSSGYSHAPTVQVSDLYRWAAPSDWFRDVGATALRKTATSLDRYYRSGIWWNDRLGVALGYLWSALTTTHIELSFAALCMALEAVASTANSEVTHILAERCAILARRSGPGRQLAYAEIKQLYALRSKIVHGRPTLRKGQPITSEALAITAKRSMVPCTQVFKLLSYVFDVTSGIQNSRALVTILHTRQSDNAESKAIDEFFLSKLLP